MKRIKLIVLLTVILSMSIAVSGTNDFWLKYTTVGDDGDEGIAAGYVFKKAATTDSLVNFWEDCELLVDTVWNTEGTPSGILESTYVSYLNLGTWYLAAKAFDEVPNVAECSNTFEKVIQDTTAPGCVTIF